MSEWIGFDLDGTLAKYDDSWHNDFGIGAPIAPMVRIAKSLLLQGKNLKIVTARASSNLEPDFRASQIAKIQKWCEEHIGVALPVTAEKDYNMLVLYDDRAIGVVCNTGELAIPYVPNSDPREQLHPAWHDGHSQGTLSAIVAIRNILESHSSGEYATHCFTSEELTQLANDLVATLKSSRKK